MLSQTAQYALRALVYIAQHAEDGPVLAREIAEKTDVPRQYLSTILREAVRSGLLKSTRGKGGGFQLAGPASKTRLLDVLRPFDDIAARTGCPFGQEECSDDNPCVFHDHWKPVAVAYQDMLNDTTLQDMQLEAMQAPKKKKKKKKRQSARRT